MRVAPFQAPFGAEVLDLDLSDAGAVGAAAPDLRALLATHRLLRWRAPDLAPDQQIGLMRCFGPVLDESGTGAGWTLVSNVADGGRLGDGEYLFHFDLEFTAAPLEAISLYALEVPDRPTHTRFADGVRAAGRLDPATRSALEGRRARHVYPLTDARGDRRYRLADLDAGAPHAEHPLLWEHPVTGETVLTATAMQTDVVIGLAEAESEALLTQAWATLYETDNVVHHEWSVGDLLVWDNRALQHARGPVHGRRTLRRVPVGELAVALRPDPVR